MFSTNFRTNTNLRKDEWTTEKRIWKKLDMHSSLLYFAAFWTQNHSSNEALQGMLMITFYLNPDMQWFFIPSNVIFRRRFNTCNLNKTFNLMQSFYLSTNLYPVIELYKNNFLTVIYIFYLRYQSSFNFRPEFKMLNTYVGSKTKWTRVILTYQLLPFNI